MFLSVENIKNLTSDKFISKEDFKKNFKIYPQYGDILLTRIGDVGTANVVDKKCDLAYYVSLALLKLKNSHPYFIKENIHSKQVQKDIWEKTLHIAFPKKINKIEIEKVIIFKPTNKYEEIKIGELFYNIDNLITLHQRKYFCSNNLIFTITTAWEQRKLSSIVDEVTRNDSTSDAPIMMITANNGFIEQSERYAFNNAGESLKKYILLKKGELAYNHGASKLRPYGSCFSLSSVENARIPFVYHCFSAKEQNSEFLSIQLNGKNIENQLRKIVSSGARMDGLLNISFEEYTSVILLLPKIKEQNKIANFFLGLENLITLHQRECFY